MPIKTYKREVRKKPTDGPAAQWSDSQKLEAVTIYLMVGNMVSVSAATGISVDRLRHWKQLPWWKEYEHDIRRSNNLQVSGKLAKIINKSADVVLDRLQNGELYFNAHTGKMDRKEVSAKTAADILSKSIDKDVLLQKLEEEPAQKEEEILDRLASIQATLRQNARKSLPIIDISSEPVHGERLPEGEPVQEATRSDQEAGGAEPGTGHSDEEGASAQRGRYGSRSHQTTF